MPIDWPARTSGSVDVNAFAFDALAADNYVNMNGVGGAASS